MPLPDYGLRFCTTVDGHASAINGRGTGCPACHPSGDARRRPEAVLPDGMVVADHVARDNRSGANTRKYLLLNYMNETAMMNLPREEAGRMHAAYLAYTEAMKKAGVLVANHGLQPNSQATTVRAPGGKAPSRCAPSGRSKDRRGAGPPSGQGTRFHAADDEEFPAAQNSQRTASPPESTL